MTLNNKHIILLIFPVFIYWIILLFNVGHTWDESYFTISSQNHYYFFEEIFSKIKNNKINSFGNIFNKTYFQKYFSYTPEHPSFFNLFGGLLLYISAKFGMKSFYMLQVFRLSNLILLFVFIIFCKKILENSNKNFVLAFSSLICLLFFNPRFMTFSVMATSDFCMTTFTFISAYYYLSDNNCSKKNIFFSALFCGLAGASKISGLFILPVILLHLLLVNHKNFLRYAAVYIIIVPVVTFIFYPVLWLDIFSGIKFLSGFFLKHYQNYVLYFGKIYSPETGPAPFHYPLFYLVFGNPEIFVILFFSALIYSKKYFTKMNFFFLLYIFMLFIMLMKPGSPSYDEIKLFLPAMPFMCLLCLKPLEKFIACFKKMKYKILIFLCFVFFSVYPAINNLKYPTLYYNILAPSLKSLEKIGFDIDIRGELFSSDVIKILNSSDKNELSIRIAGQEPSIFNVYNSYYKVFNKRVECSLFQTKFDYLILLNHKSLFQKVDHYYWDNIKPEATVKYKGVTLYSVYKINTPGH